MTCLNDIQIQALADGEATAEAARHAAECPTCGARLRDRERAMTAIRQTLDVPVGVPVHLAQRVGDVFRLKAEATESQRGATRLRSDSRGFRLPWPEQGRGQAEGKARWIYSGLAVAAATLIAVLFITPVVRGPDATASASEILAKSASQ